MESKSRLQAARCSVHLATQQAYAALISSNKTITGTFATDAANDNHDEFTIIEDGDNNDTNTNDNTRAGMDLGLSLFGTSQSYMDQLEEEFDEKLRDVEKELEDIQSGLGMLLEDEDGSGTSASGSGVAAMTMSNERSTMSGLRNEDDYYSDYCETMSEMIPANSGGEDQQLLPNDVARLQTHITFLQQCARARKMLEDVDTLQMTTNFAIARSSSCISPDNGSTAFMSPSSICSPSEFIKFTFESVATSGGAKAGGGLGSPLVQAAGLVQQAEEVLNEIMEKMKQQHRDGVENDNDGGVTQMQSEMLNELQHQTRRKKMELRHRATTLVDGCIALEEDILLVRGSGSVGGGGTALAALDMTESPISAVTPRDGTPPSPLSDAYRVLQLFSDDRFPTFGETLDGAMKRLSRRLMDVIQPCLNELESQKKEQISKGGGDTTTAGYYKFTQETLRSVARSSSGGDRKYDPVGNLKGPAEQLQWKLLLASFDNDGDNAEEDGTITSIATCADIDEKALSSLPTGTIATFLTTLNFLSNFLSFVHEHVLLRRMDLAAMLGKHLFGRYPLSPKETSIDFGSAVLGGGGVLVGAAAQGLEEGESRPLMTMMVKSMRRWCVPKGDASSEVVWGMLREMEVCLIKEVGAFEDKMAGIGLMNVLAGGGGAGDVGNSSATSSSPTGLSVLLNNESNGMVESPIHPNATTLSNLTTLDTTFPQALSTKKAETGQSTMNIISPLSQLAHSLRQAYVEDQRSHILNRGRSILLNTDYHNTVRVGTFVPDDGDCPADSSGKSTPLASLDADRMTTLFAFHQCSVSTTVQQIIDLCRETLDVAASTSSSPSPANDAGEDNLDSLPPMLYRTSRELLDLFRAIVPTLHASEVGSIPRTAAVLHNDCVYLAHESSLLGAEYKSKFRSFESSMESSPEGKGNKAKLLGEVCTFVDMVPPFRDLATKSMGFMIELQKGQLYELISPRLANFQQALASNESVSEWDDAETALRAALYHLRHLSQAWTPVLSRNVYHMSMGNLVDLVFTLFLDPVWKAEDITETASRFIHTLFLDMARGAAEMFLADSGGAAPANHQELSSTENTMQHRFQVAKKFATLFEKSQAMGQFMAMRLSEIHRGLEEGVFRSVTARELSHLISAAFDDSEKRTALLNVLASK